MPLDALVTGRIATFAGEAGFGWVEAIGIKNGRVAFAGSAIELETRADPFTVRHELDPDEVAIPGLTDSHLHLADGGIALEQVDLPRPPTLDEGLALDRGGPRAATRWRVGRGPRLGPGSLGPLADGRGSRGRGARQARRPLGPRPSLALGQRSCAGGRRCGRLEGRPGRRVRPPRRPGRGDRNSPRSRARLVTDRVPRPTEDRYERLIALLARQLVELGVVAVHDPGALASQTGLGPSIAAYRTLAERGALPSARPRLHPPGAARRRRPRPGSGAATACRRAGERARLGWLKLFADGTLASRTAALLDPIEPEPGRPLPPGTERGVFITPPDSPPSSPGGRPTPGSRRSSTRSAITPSGPLSTRSSRPPAGPLMPRLEHVQLLHPDDRGRFAKSGIAASVQPVHLRADAAAARRLWGDRAERNGYPWRTLVDSGAVVAFGTDAPVEPIDPWPGLAMAVTRIRPGLACRDGAVRTR